MPRSVSRCEWLGLRDALRTFVSGDQAHQSSRHIKPLHWYLACRLVIEGGFEPNDITPRPPFTVTARGDEKVLSYSQGSGGTGERTVLGGLKTKDVDVVVSKDGVGPVLAVSVKGTLKAFRNLTNRMEEAVGDCTNLHISYPALVYGFMHVMSANRAGPGVDSNDIAIESDGRVSDAIVRYHDVLSRLAGRTDLRDDPTKYEAVALALIQPDKKFPGEVLSSFPTQDSALLLEDFFRKLYEQYDRRFVYAAPSLDSVTRRNEWVFEGDIAKDARVTGYEVRKKY